MSAPAVAVAKSGKRVWVAWKQVARGAAQISWRALDSRADSPVRPDGGAERNHPAMALDSDGTPWICWEERRGARQSVWLRALRPDSPAVCLNPSESGVSGFPVLAVTGDRVWVAWEVRRGDQTRVVATSRTRTAR